MLPKLLIGSWEISTYSLMWGLAMVVAGMVSFHRLVRGGLPARPVALDVGLIALAGLGGAFFVEGVALVVRALLPHAGLTLAGRVTFFGALTGAIIAGFACIRRRRWPVSVGRLFDLGGLPLPLLEAIGRLGCVAAGCCGGKPTASWLGISLPDTAGVWATRYPTQWMDMIASLLILAALLSLPQARPFDGFVFLLYLAL